MKIPTQKNRGTMMTKLTLLNVDLSQAELRVMAVLSQDKWMMDALQEGRGDFFNTHMMPVCFPWIEDEYGTVENYELIDPTGHKEDRTKVKGIQYGLAFGRQAFAISKALNITKQAAVAIIDNYLTTAYGFAEWRVNVMRAATQPAYRDLLVNPFGRRFQSEIITAKKKSAIEREALSFLPQSTSSDICLSTAIRINDRLNERGYYVFNLVHDAIMIEGPDDLAELSWAGNFICSELRLTGERVMGPQVPFLAEWSTGDSWADLS